MEKHKRIKKYGNGSNMQPFYDDPEITAQFIIDDDRHSDNDEEVLYPTSKKSNNGVTGREKVLIALIFVLLIIILALASAGTFGYYYAATKEPCMDPSCVATSASLINMMDLTMDPCTDFYEYSCGSFLKEVVPPAGTSKWTSFSRVYAKNQQILKKVLENPGDVYRRHNSTAIAKVKNYYNACMNTSGIEDMGSTPMLELIKKLGSWSVTSDDISGAWKKENFVFEEVLANSHLLSTAPFFDLFVTADDKHSDVHIIQVEQSGLGLDAKEYYFDNSTDTQREAYIILTASVMTLLGADEDKAMQRAKDIFSFEYNLAKIFVEEETDPEEAYNTMTVKELGDIMPAVNFRKYLDLMFEDTKIKDSDVIIVPTPQYFINMSKLIEKTDESLLADYIVWNTIGGMVGYLSNAFLQLLVQYTEATRGVSDLPPHWETCVGRADGALGMATGALFIEKEFPPESKDSVENMVMALREAFAENLPTVNWMDSLTREKALTKLEAITNKIGYPRWLENPQKLDEHYEKLQLSPDSSFDNMIAVKKFYLRRNLDKVHEPVDKTEWSMVPAEVNAYYNPSYNEIVFPAGILQSPYYSPLYPMSFNFGAIGMVIGHELTHGFDTQGRHYDANGNLVNWWQNSSAIQFEKHAGCMINQYNQYPIGDIHLNGETTINENIADNGGLKVAYMAYKNWASTQPTQQPLPGLDLNAEQLFFIGHAQVWCAYYTPEYAMQSVFIDEHSNDKYRVIGVESNFEPFSTAFDCPLGSPMNPENKCAVW